MLNLELGRCARCHQMTWKVELGSVIYGGQVRRLCRECRIKLVEKNTGYRQTELEFADKVAHREEPLGW